ncbi:MAG: hypothetical protein V8S35_08695 [Lachnospira sp.]
MNELNALPNGKWNLYEKEFKIEPDGQYVIYAKITDKAENAIYVSSDGMILDATLPKFGGVEQMESIMIQVKILTKNYSSGRKS